MLLIKQQSEHEEAVKERKVYLCGEYTVNTGCNLLKTQRNNIFYKSPTKVKVKAKVKARVKRE